MIRRVLIPLLLLTVAPHFSMHANADFVDFMIDSSQSEANITIAFLTFSQTDSSPTSGMGTIDLIPSTEPFGTAQITELTQVLDDDLSFLFGVGLSMSTMGGDVVTELVTPGPAGPVSGGTFTQNSNVMQLSGMVNVMDSSGALGGDTVFDLGSISLIPIDFADVSVTRIGDVITLSGDYLISGIIPNTMGPPVTVTVEGIICCQRHGGEFQSQQAWRSSWQRQASWGLGRRRRK